MKLRILIAALSMGLFIFIGSQLISLYSVWDDEANTALFAQSVHETGDTSAIRGNNIIAFRGGSELNEDLKARYVSPLQYYFLAPFISSTEPQPIRAKIPFFCLSILSLFLIYRRLYLQKLSTPIFLGFLFVTTGLVSFVLFSIQCRYYALTLFFSVILADLYWFQQLDTTKKRFFFSLIGAFLFISNYLNGIAALGAFFAHALLFRRKDLVQVIGPRCRGLAALILPQLLISLPVFFIWNPIGKNVVTQKNSLFDKMELLWRNIRDFNSGGMGCVLLLILGLIIFKNSSQRRFKQYTLLFFSYIALVSFFSPQPVHGTAMADIRYLFPLMVLGLIWTVDFWYQLYPRSKLAFGAGMIFFSFLALPYNGTFQIPLLNLIHELNEPADDPYQVVATWLNENVQPGASIFSSLDFGTYPLMYLAPRFRYFGQFESDFNSTPDYVVSFCNDEVLNRVTAHYTLVKEFGIACREAYRPEYFLRTFGKNQFRGRVAIFRLGQTK